MILLWLAIFSYGFALDILQVIYTAAIVKNKTLTAANISVLYSGIAAGAVVSIAQNKWLFVPYLIGVWTGSLVGMWLKRRQEDWVIKKKNECEENK